MFGYRLIHKDTLEAITTAALALQRVTQAAPSPDPRGAPTVSGPSAPRDVAVPEPLPDPIEQAVAQWEPWTQPGQRQYAAELLAQGMTPEAVARRIADGDPVDD